MMNRRNFLMLFGGGVTGVLLTPALYKTIYDAAYWTQNWGWIPRLKYGANAYIPSISKICPSGAGVLIRTVANRPVRTLPSETNILSQGGLSALAATETQLACSPSRVKYPLKRSADGAYIRITWAEAEKLLVEKSAAAKKSVAAISGDMTGSINDLFSAFLNKLGSKDFYLMPSEERDAQIAWEDMGGKGRIGYNIEDADFVYSIGANYLENWGTVLYNRKVYADKRPVGKEKSLTVAYVGAGQTNTAACADYFLPAKVNTETVVALGIAQILITKGYKANFAGFAEFSNFVKEYSPAKVAELTGIPAQKFIASVDALVKAKKPLVLVGSEMSVGLGALPIMAGIACNMLLANGNNNAGQVVALPIPPKALAEADDYTTVLKRDLINYTQAVAQNKTKAPAMLYVYSANPLYALPKDAQVQELIKKSGYVVAFSSFLDETSKQADLILPQTMSFERFDDINTPYGSGFVNYAVGQPAVQPAYESAPTADVVFGLAKALKVGFDIQNGGELVAMKAQALGADMDSLLEGMSFVSDEMQSGSKLAFNTKALSMMQKPTNGLAVQPTVTSGIGTATTGIPPFATKIITNNQLIGTTMVAQMNSATAAKIGTKAGAKLKLSNENGQVLVLVSIFEGVQNDTLLVPAGLGHTAFDAFSQNKGDNILNLTKVTKEAGSTANVYAPIYVTAEKA